MPARGAHWHSAVRDGRPAPSRNTELSPVHRPRSVALWWSAVPSGRMTSTAKGTDVMAHASRARLRRRSLALVCAAGAAVLTVGAAPGAPAQSSPPPEGLFGTGDPTYDGVWRQSLALLAQDAAGYTPASEAVSWLLDQQCDDGSFLAYRPDPERECGDVSAADTNATATAVQALAALGEDGEYEEEVSSALAWLEGVQNADGGWAYNPGGASDANSTALVVGAFAAAGEDPAEVTREGASPFDALAGLQLGCDAPQAERGAFAVMPDEGSGELYANDLATVDAVLASYGSGLVVDPEQAEANAAVEPVSCDGNGTGGGDDATDGAGDADGEPEDADASAGASGQPEGPDEPDDAAGPEQGVSPGAASGAAGAAYLAAVLAEQDQHLLSAVPDDEEQPDYAATARAVLALAASGDPEAASGPLGWLEDNHGAWRGLTDSPGALGLLVLAAHAGGASPEDFGGTDLLAALNELGPAPDQTPGEATGGAAAESSEDGGGSGALVWVLGAGLLAGIVIGVVLSLRRGRGAGR